MSMVEVHNLNAYPYKEMFRGKEIQIKAEDFIKMENDDAVMFLGALPNVERDGDGNILPRSYKKLRIVRDGSGKRMVEERKKREVAFKCNACGYNGNSEQDLHIHTKEEHVHQLEDPKVAKQMLKEK